MQADLERITGARLVMFCLELTGDISAEVLPLILPLPAVVREAMHP